MDCMVECMWLCFWGLQPIPIWKGVAVNISRWYTLPINIWCSISIVCHNRQWIESYTLRWKIPCMERRVFFSSYIWFHMMRGRKQLCFQKQWKKTILYLHNSRISFSNQWRWFVPVVTVGGDCIGGLRNFLTNNITHKQHND